MPETIVGSVGVQLVPSAKGFSEKAKALLRGLTVDVVLNVQDAKAKAELDEATKPREAKIEADADTAKANAELDEAAHTREATINANVDSGGSGERLNELARNRTAHINTDVGGGGFGLLTTAVLGLGPALVPVTAAVGGLGAALGAGIVGGAGGATVYGFLTGLAIKNTEKQLKAIAQLQKKVTADRLTLAQATTKAGKKSAMAQLAADTKSYKQALDLLSPAQHRFMADQAALKTAFTQFSSKNGNALFGPVNAGLRTLTHLLPAASPLVKAVSFSLRGLVDQVDHWAKSSGPSKVAKFLANLAAPSITNIGQTLGNVAKGIGGMIRAAAPLGTKVLKSIEGWSEKFAASKHNGFKSFLDYVQKVGPQVASTASSVGKAIGRIVKAAAPVGGVTLHAIKGLADAISNMPTGVLTGIVASLGGLAVTMKGIAAAKGAVAVLRGISGLKGGLSGGIGGALGKIGGSASKVVNIEAAVVNVNGGKGGVPSKGTPGVPVAGPAGGIAAALGTVAGVAGLVTGGLALENVFINSRQKFKPQNLNVPYNVANKAPHGFTQHEMGAAAIRAEQQGVDPKTAQRYNDQLQRLIDLDRKLYPAAKDASAGVAALGQTITSQIASDPSKAFGSLLNVSDATGISVKHLAQLMPRVAAALKAAGIPATRFGVALASLPKKVQTKVTAPGAEVSGKNIAALAKKYNLTPRQVKTLVSLLGQKGALSAAIRLGRQYHITPKQVRTIVSQYGADPSRAEVAKLAHQYNITPKQVRTLLNAVDNATPTVRNAQRAIDSLTGKTVTITTIHQAINYSYDAKRAGIPHRASGGPVKAAQPYVVGEVGPELFVPSGSGTIIPNNHLTPAAAAQAPGAGRQRYVLEADGMQLLGGWVRAEADDRIAAAGAMAGQTLRAGVA